jgi:hypothetical protein
MYLVNISFVVICYSSVLFAGEGGVKLSNGQYHSLRQQTPFFSEKNGGLVQQLEAAGLVSGIRDIRFDGVVSSVSGNLISLRNLRILSDTTSLDDYISIDFLLDADSLRLIPGNFEVIEDLGIYYQKEYFFSKDVNEALSMTIPGGGTLASDTLHTLTVSANDEFTMLLQAGTLMTMRLLNPTDDYELQIDGPDGGSYERGIYHQGSKWNIGNRTIFQTGVYTFRFVPDNDSSMTLELGFTNNNRQPLTAISAGSSISVSLSGWGYEYAKYKISLNKGDTIEVTDPSDDDIWLYLVNSDSRGQASGSGEIYTQVSSTGDYYLFVQNRDHENAGSYSGTVTVTPDPDVSKYPVLAPVSEQTVPINHSFSLQLSASNSPNKFTASGLPAGLSIHETTGLVSGMPSIAGKFLLRATAENEFGSDQTDFFLKIQEQKKNKVVVIPLL